MTAATPKNHMVSFTTKGQVVIPSALRKEFHIEEGTKAVVVAMPDGILLKPVSRHTIQRLHGIIKPKAGDAPLAQEWAEHKKQERKLEEPRHGRRGPR